MSEGRIVENKKAERRLSEGAGVEIDYLPGDFSHRSENQARWRTAVCHCDEGFTCGRNDEEKNHPLVRAIGDVGMGEFGRQLAYKAAWSGSRFIKADRCFPSSKRCSRCDQVKETLALSERVYRGTDCGLEIDRDLNAALNLEQLSTASSAGI